MRRIGSRGGTGIIPLLFIVIFPLALVIFLGWLLPAVVILPGLLLALLIILLGLFPPLIIIGPALLHLRREAVPGRVVLGRRVGRVRSHAPHDHAGN